MSQPPSKVWKHLVLLSIGLVAYGLIVVRTIADVYGLITQPAAGFEYKFVGPESPPIIVSVEENSPADLAGFQPGDTLFAIRNRVIQNQQVFQERWSELPVGEPAEIELHRPQGAVRVVVVPKQRGLVYLREALLGILPISLFAYFLCIVGTFVYLKRINDRSAIVFYLLALAFANAMRNATNVSVASAAFLPGWWDYLFLPSWPLAIGLFLHFHLLFPGERAILRRRPRLTLAAIYAPLSLIVPFVALNRTVPVLAGRILDIGWGVWLTLYFCIALGLLGAARTSAADPTQRKQAQIMFWGAILGLVPSLTYGFLPALLFQYSPPASEITLLTLMIWPVSIAYAIIRHRFLDIEFIVRKGMAYALLSGFVIGLYLLLVVVAGRLLLLVTGSSSQLFTIFATVVIAALFSPAKNRIQDFVDRRYYRRRFSYRQDVRELSRRLVKVLDLDELFRLLVHHLGETMHIRPVAIFWRGSKDGPFQLREASRGDGLPLELPESDEVCDRLASTLQLVDVAALERSLSIRGRQLAPIWRQLQSEICLPLVERDRLIGILVLGRKDSDEPYTASDIELLETVSDQANIALENALLSEELRERERMKKELEVARRIQMTSLPRKDPQVPGLEISGMSLPAYEVGGDYYDYLALDDTRFGVVVGDVSGKSTSAALYMAKIQGILHSLAPLLPSPQELLVRVNSLAYAGLDRQSFITLALGIFEPRRRRLTLLRAGHLPVLFLRAEDGKVCRLIPSGLGLGLDPGPLFEKQLQAQTVVYRPGDLFVFYTDGVTEAINPKRQLLDLEGLESIVARQATKDAGSIRDTIIEAVRRHADGQALSDDLTVVVIRATG